MTDAALNEPTTNPVAQGISRLHSRGRSRCPHCGAPARIRTSRRLTPTYAEQTYQCTNIACGHTYLVGAEVLRTLSPSGTPNPDVHIPLSTHARAGTAKP